MAPLTGQSLGNGASIWNSSDRILLAGDFFAAMLADLGPLFNDFRAERTFARVEPVVDFLDGGIHLSLCIVGLSICTEPKPSGLPRV